MHFNTIAFAAIASVAVAQTATTSAASSGSSCAAQNIVEACKSTTNGQIASCQGNDWDCLCTQYQNLLTCYNNCPGDPVGASVKQQVEQYCRAASAYGTSTKAAAVSTSAGLAQSTSASATVSGASKSSTSPTPTGNGAASLQIPGSLAAIVLAGFGLLA